MGAADLLAHVRAAGFTLDLAAGKLLVTPASMLTDELRAALRASKPGVLALLAAEHEADAEAFDERAAIMEFDGGLFRAAAEVTARQCVGGEGMGTACAAFIGKMPTAATDLRIPRHRGQRSKLMAGSWPTIRIVTQAPHPGCPRSPGTLSAIRLERVSAISGMRTDRPHRLTNDDVDGCHAPFWNDAEIAAFTARTERFALLGRADADDLAERLTLRDRDGDDRRLCLECTWLGGTGRCLATATGCIPGADRRLEPVHTVLQRCVAFGLRKGLV